MNQYPPYASEDIPPEARRAAGLQALLQIASSMMQPSPVKTPPFANLITGAAQAAGSYGDMMRQLTEEAMQRKRLALAGEEVGLRREQGERETRKLEEIDLPTMALHRRELEEVKIPHAKNEEQRVRDEGEAHRASAAYHLAQRDNIRYALQNEQNFEAYKPKLMEEIRTTKNHPFAKFAGIIPFLQYKDADKILGQMWSSIQPHVGISYHREDPAALKLREREIELKETGGGRKETAGIRKELNDKVEKIRKLQPPVEGFPMSRADQAALAQHKRSGRALLSALTPEEQAEFIPYFLDDPAQDNVPPSSYWLEGGKK